MILEKTLMELNKLIQEAKENRILPYLFESGEDLIDENYKITDLKIKPVSLSIEDDSGVVAEECFYYILTVEGIGELNVFDASFDIEPFFGEFRAYYESYDILMVERLNEEHDEFKTVENFFCQIDICNLLSQETTQTINDYISAQITSYKKNAISVLSKKIGGIQINQIEYSGKHIELFTGQGEIPVILTIENYKKIFREN